MTKAHTFPTIDEYLRERLMPVEGAIPHIAGIDMYGNSSQPGPWAATCLNTSPWRPTPWQKKKEKSYFRGKSTLVIKPDEPNAAQH